MDLLQAVCQLRPCPYTCRYDSRRRSSFRPDARNPNSDRHAVRSHRATSRQLRLASALPCVCSARQNSQVPGASQQKAAAKAACRPLLGLPCHSVLLLQSDGTVQVADRSVSVVFLAGGTGKRMGASMPKQYLQLLGQPIAMHSLNTFGSMREVGEIIVVCDPSYRDLFQQYLDRLPSEVQHSFALPGIERQDSVLSGLQAISSKSALVAVHDSARPLLQAGDAAACMLDAQQTGAAVLGVPVKPTIKEVDSSGMVVKTLVRACLWEVQTPQVIKPELLRKGFELVQQSNLEVTDDVSIIEAMGLPVKITKGSYTNIKVTTPDDMLVAEGFLISKDSEYSVVGPAGTTNPASELAAASSQVS